MALYEHIFLARQDLAQAQVDTMTEEATKIIADNGSEAGIGSFPRLALKCSASPGRR